MIEMKYGRKDAVKPEDCVDEGNLPAGNAPFPDSDTPQARSSFLINLYYFLCQPVTSLGPIFASKGMNRCYPGDKTLFPPYTSCILTSMAHDQVTNDFIKHLR